MTAPTVANIWPRSARGEAIRGSDTADTAAALTLDEIPTAVANVDMGGFTLDNLGAPGSSVVAAARIRDTFTRTVVLETTAARTLALTDANLFIEGTNAAGCALTIAANATIPHLVGTLIPFRRNSATGTFTFTGATGVTVNGTLAGTVTLADRNRSVVWLYQRATNNWAVFGDTALRLVNDDIATSAAIAYSKLALTGAILNADLAGSITGTKVDAGTTTTRGTLELATAAELLAGTDTARPPSVGDMPKVYTRLRNGGFNPGTMTGTAFPVHAGVPWAIKAAVALGTIRYVRVVVPPNELITNIHWVASGTGRTVGANPSLWSGLYAITAGARNLLAVSADLTSAAWSAGAEKVFPLGVAYQTPDTANGTEYLFALCDYASSGGTSPTLHGITSAGAGVPALMSQACHFAGQGSTGVTTVPALGSSTGTVTGSVDVPFCGWS